MAFGEELPPVVVRVRAEADEALLKLRAIRDEIKALRSKTVKLDVDASQARAANATLRDTRKIVKDLTKDAKSGGNVFERFWKGMTASGAGGRNQRGFFGNIMDGLQRLSSGFSAAAGNATIFGQDLAPLISAGGPVVIAAPLILALASAAAALVQGLLSAGGAVIAAGIGIGALYAVARPTITALRTGLTALSTATSNYQAASGQLNTALKTSWQDTAAYNAVIQGLAPNLRSAAALLRDGSVQWQNLSKSQRNNVVALANNSDALKHMLPAQKAALSALMGQKKAWDNLTPSQQKAATSMQAIGATWSKVTAAMAPAVNGLIADVLKLVQTALPYVQPLANAAAGSIDKLLRSATRFVQSERFKLWMQNLIRIIPGAITQIGGFIGKLVTLAGKVMVNKNSLKDLHNTLSTVLRIVQTTATVVHNLADMFNYANRFLGPFVGFLGKAASVASTLMGSVSGLTGALGGLSGAASSLGSVGGIVSGIMGAIGGHATGTDYAPPGLAWVGEKGPELMRFTGGETVFPHGESMAISRGYASGVGNGCNCGGDITVNVDGQKLFQIVKQRSHKYNLASGGIVTGKLIPH